MLSWFVNRRKQLAEYEYHLRQPLGIHHSGALEFFYYVVCLLARIVVAVLKAALEVPIHFAYQPTDSFTLLARRSDSMMYLESYTGHHRRAFWSIATTLSLLIVSVLQLSLLAYSLVAVSTPQQSQAATSSKFIAFWDGGTPPAGWTCISCSPGDDFYQLFPRGNSTYGGSGGTATHTHTQTLLNSLNSNPDITSSTKSSGSGFAVTAHEMTALTNTVDSTDSSIPPYRDLKVIRYETPGNPSQIPAGVIVPFDVVPSGSWSRYTAQDGNYIFGANDATSTGGSATEVHTFSGTATTSNARAGTTGLFSSTTSGAHTHTYSSSTAAVNHEPLRVDVLLYKSTATIPLPPSALGLWSGTPPAGWTVVSGAAQTYNTRYLRGASSFASSGGAATHTPSDTTFNSDVSNDTAQTSSAAPQIQIEGDTSHIHELTIGFNSVNNAPPYRDVIIAQKDSVSTTVSGRVFTDEGSTGLDCTSPRTIAVRVNGGGSYSTTCSNAPANGSFSIANVAFSAGDIITIYIDGAVEKGVTVTRASNTAISADVYTNHVIVRHEDDGPISNADLDQFDSGQDSDIPYAVTAGALTVASGTELHVFAGSTFTPGGTVTTTSSATQSGYDGDVHVPATATLVLNTNALSVGGDLNNAGTISISAGQTTTFTATGSGFQITPGTLSFANVITNGTSGTWNAQANIIITENLTISAGTFALGAHNLTVGSTGVTNSGTVQVASGQSLTQTSGSTTTILSSASGANCLGSTGASCSGTAGTMTFGALTIGDGTTVFTSTLGATTPTITTANTLLVTTNASFVADNASLNVGASFTNSGTFSNSGGTVTMTGTGTLTSGTATLNNLAVSGSGTVTLANATHTIAGNLTFVSSKTITAGTSTLVMSGNGKVLTGASRTVYRLTINGTVSTSGSLTVSNALTVNSGKTLTLGSSLLITSASSITMTGGTIDGSGTLVYNKTTGFPSDGTINANVQLSAASGSITLPAQNYGGSVSCASVLSPLTCNFTGTTTIAGNVILNAINADASFGGSPTSVTIGGNVFGVTDAATSTLIMSGNWTIHGDVDFSGITSVNTGTSTLTMDANNVTNTATLTSNGQALYNVVLQPALNKTVVLAPAVHYIYGDITLGGSGTLTSTGSTIRTNSTGKTLTSNGKTIGSLLLNSGNLTLVDAASLSEDLTIGNATLIAPTTTLQVGGNFTNGGTFTANNGTVILNGSGTTILSGTTTFNNLTSTTAGKHITFTSASSGTPVFTVAGTLTLTGSNVNHIYLAASSAGNQWLAHFNTAQANLTYTDILDSGCDTGTSNVTLDATSVNAGNNAACWVFPAPMLSVNDGTGADATYGPSLTTLSANWSLSDTTNVVRYEYAIGTTIGGTDIAGYTSNLLATSVTRNGLSLIDGTTYYTTVRAVNTYSITVASSTSNGITVNTALPVITDAQAGDTTPRRLAGTTYQVSFSKAPTGAQIELGQYTVFTGPNKTGTQVLPLTTIFSGATNAYATPWTVDFASLPEGVSYVTVNVHALDALSSELIDAFTILKDTAAPTISTISTTPSTTSVLTSWTTNEQSTAQFEYGLTNAYGSSSALNSSLSTSHVITITGLVAGTVYHGRSINIDAAGNTTIGNDVTWTTTSVSTPTPTPTTPIPTPSDISTPTITNFRDGDSTADTTPTIAGTGPALGGIYILVDRQLVRTVPVDARGQYLVDLTTPLSIGTHAIVVRAKNLQGLLSDESTPINLKVVTPSIGTTVVWRVVTDGQRPTITFGAVAPVNATVLIYLDATLVRRISTTSSTPPAFGFTTTITPSAWLPVGKHTISFVTVQANGKMSAPTGLTTFVKSAPSAVSPTPVTYHQQTVYRVQAGDSLWSIAAHFLGDGRRWKELQQQNIQTLPSLTTHPEQLKLGWSIVIPAQ